MQTVPFFVRELGFCVGEPKDEAMTITVGGLVVSAQPWMLSQVPKYCLKTENLLQVVYCNLALDEDNLE
jgi:hypothetical protein